MLLVPFATFMLRNFFLMGIAALIFSAPLVVRADDPAQPVSNPDCPKNRQCLQNPLEPVGKDKAGPVEVPVILGTIIKAALGVLGSIALFVFINGGTKWFLSFGSSDKIKEGAMTMLWAALGLLVVLASYFVLNWYINLVTT